MEYHTPDPIWRHIIGAHDYESYLANIVVRGRFHRAVPKAVVESYTVAEYIMAHAWYHYPMLDEALVKLLRVLEMGVKMRCTELDIPIKRINNKRGKEIHTDISLNILIKSLVNAEPAKNIGNVLDWLRGVRNYLMHPKEKSLFGSIALGHIRHCITMLNAIFLPEQYFLEAKVELDRVRRLAKVFERGLFVLDYKSARYIVFQCQFVESFLVEEEWQVLCVLQLVGYEPADDKERVPSPVPLVFLISHIQVGPESLSGINTESQEPFVLSTNTNPQNAVTFAQFESDLELLGENRWIFESRRNDLVTSKLTELRYWYWGYSN